MHGKTFNCMPIQYIVNLSIISYRPERSKKVDLLEHILRVLPNLRRLDLSRSHYYFGEDNIQQVINNCKDLYIKATRVCPQSKGKKSYLLDVCKRRI